MSDGLEHDAGLVGLAGTADMRGVLTRAASGDADATLALDVYVYRVRTGIAAMAAAMGGVDALAFTGGVGEHAPEIRRRAVDGLGFLGVAIDAARNDSAAADTIIGLDGARVAVGRRRGSRRHGDRPAGPGLARRCPMTNPELPDGVTVETVYAVEISYSPEAKERRPAVRIEHLTRVARLLREGTLVEAGRLPRLQSALLIFRVGSEQDAIDIVRDDVYLRAGVWLDDPKVRAWSRVIVDASR